MKKSLLIFCTLALFSVSSFSQIKFGIKAGLSTSQINMDAVSLNSSSSSIDSTFKAVGSSKLGVHFGVTSEVSFMSFFVKPELYFSTSSAEYQIVENNGTTENITSLGKQTYNKLNIPVIVGTKFGPLRVGLGPVATILVQKKSDLLKTGVTQTFNSATFGMQFGAGIDLGPLGLDLRYETSLSKFGNGIEVGGQTRSFDARPSQWLVSLTYYIL